MFLPANLIKSTFFSITFLFTVQSSYAQPSAQIIADIADPSSSAVIILNAAINDLAALKDKNTSESIKEFINLKIIPHLSIETSAKFALKDHWGKFNEFEKKTFSRYIERSLSRDYISFLSSYDSSSNVMIKANSPAKIKNNKAIVPISVLVDGTSKPITVTLRMIFSDTWKIYDVVYKGVSLAKNYRFEFNSHIRRKGVPSLIKKINRKLSTFKVSF